MPIRTYDNIISRFQNNSQLYYTNRSRLVPITYFNDFIEMVILKKSNCYKHFDQIPE